MLQPFLHCIVHQFSYSFVYSLPYSIFLVNNLPVNFFGLLRQPTRWAFHNYRLSTPLSYFLWSSAVY